MRAIQQCSLTRQCYSLAALRLPSAGTCVSQLARVILSISILVERYSGTAVLYSSALRWYSSTDIIIENVVYRGTLVLEYRYVRNIDIDTLGS